MIKVLTAISTLLLLVSCGTSQPDAAVTQWDEDNLNGKVKSVTTRFFAAITPVPEGFNNAIIKNTERFDEDGKLIEEIYSVDSVIDDHVFYSYNNDGNILQRKSCSEDNDYTTLIYTYNDKGLNTKIEEEHSNGVTFVLIEKEYNEQGLPIRTFENNHETEIAYTYDSNNRLYETIRLYDRVVHDYDNSGRLVSLKTYENGSNKLLTIETLVYDSRGRLTKESYRDAESPSTLNYDRIMGYDDKDRLVERKFISIDMNGKESLGNQFIYTYDEKGNMVEEKALTNHFDNTSTIQISTYTYDEQGNWIKAQYAGKEETVTTTREIEYY